MREVILKKDVLEIIHEERLKLEKNDKLSTAEKQYINEFLSMLYHKFMVNYF